MLHPLVALLAVVSLGTAGGATEQSHGPSETGAGGSVVQSPRDELTRLREEKRRLHQRLSELRAEEGRHQEDSEHATGGAGEAGEPEAPASSEQAAPPSAVPPSQEQAVSEELRALRQEVAELRQAVMSAEARFARPVEPVKPPEAKSEPEPPSEREAALDLLRNSEVLTVQNASPLERQVMGEVMVANRTQTGEVGFVLEPRVRVGTPWKVEFGAGAQLQNLAGEQEGTTGAVEAYALGQLVEEKRAVPQVALLGEVTSPQGDEGVSAEARVLATKTFGQTRLHGNVGYRASQDSPDDYLLGLAADHPIGDRLLLQGDAYYVNPLGDEEASVNASVGTGVRVGSSFVVTGAVGVNATAADVAPRLLFGVIGRI
ncbi:hypothetical protein JRI60_01215 [Archangium violaceum]|uniref:hypothetical protein n=1 Tax=Archangium violaceum TaxID=83451 RepID=UPI00194E6807|nr:hypothetical protein [Archangium violaceum]QRN97737.1 hypothetical protein JRI60_01215 [Archangium violaceum]